MRALINITLYDYHSFLPDSYIIFDKEILEVGSMKEFEANDEMIIDGKGMLLMPGLVNFHTHIYSTLFRGLDMGVSPKNFTEVLEDMWWRFDKELTLKDLYNSGLAYGRASICSGVTALIDHNASGIIAGSIEALRNGIKQSSGMKAVYCFESSDRFDVAACIEENQKSIKEGHGIFGLHASLSLSTETLNRIQNAIGQTPIHVHVAESEVDESFTRETFDQSVVERFMSHKLLNKNSILAHCVHIDEQEAEIISSSACKVVVNPTSNLNNAVGLFDYDLFRKNNIQLLVGTDGLGSNIAKEWQNLYYVGKQSMKNPSGICLEEIRNYIIESYDYFNSLLGVKIGRLAPSHDADFILVDYEAPTPMTAANAFGHIFFGVFDQLRPHSVFIEGCRRLEAYKLVDEVSVDEGDVEALWERVRR